MNARQFSQLPPLHRREVRLSAAPFTRALEAASEVSRIHGQGVLRAVVFLALGAAAGYFAVTWNARHPGSQDELMATLGFEPRGHADLKGALYLSLLFAPAVACALVGLVAYFRLPSSLAASVVPKFLRDAQGLFAGPVNLSVFWGVLRGEGPFADNEFALEATLASGAPVLLAVDTAVSRRTSTHSHGGRVHTQSRTSSHRVVSLVASLPTASFTVREPLPAIDGVACEVQREGALVHVSVERSLGSAACTPADLAQVLRAFADIVSKR